jgi:coenzyme F420-reducing hydrogenase alpha subunit
VSHRTRQLRVSSLARVEGEGGLRLVIDGDRVDEVELQIYEPPRFFEAFLRGRQYTEVLDITARICGICPVAYQTSGWNAIEDACGATVDERIAALRRLLYCGEWISSHTLHIYLLHAVDFLGYQDAITLAQDHRPEVERGLAMKKAGNAVLETVGGRAIHPVNPRIGGFHRAPTRADLAPLAEQLRRALDQALETVTWVAGFDMPDIQIDHELVAVHHPDRYAIETGMVATASGLRIPPSEYPDHAVEHQEPHSTALHSTFDGGRYLTGPLARYTINYPQLSPLAREAATAAGLGESCRNPFQSIIVRAVETVYAIEEALRIIDGYERPEPPAADVAPRAGVGHGVSEAPRGLLYHRYELAADGAIKTATIVPPTAQNQPAIEDDLRRVVGLNLELDDGALTALCEQTIRNYDPCISCSTHFLDLTIERR